MWVSNEVCGWKRVAVMYGLFPVNSRLGSSWKQLQHVDSYRKPSSHAPLNPWSSYAEMKPKSNTTDLSSHIKFQVSPVFGWVYFSNFRPPLSIRNMCHTASHNPALCLTFVSLLLLPLSRGHCGVSLVEQSLQEQCYKFVSLTSTSWTFKKIKINYD